MIFAILVVTVVWEIQIVLIAHRVTFVHISVKNLRFPAHQGLTRQAMLLTVQNVMKAHPVLKLELLLLVLIGVRNHSI